MPLSYNISKASSIKIDEQDGHPVLEIEFPFVRYRLMLDDFEKAEEMANLIVEAIAEGLKGKEETERLAMPRFYSKGKFGGKQ